MSRGIINGLVHSDLYRFRVFQSGPGVGIILTSDHRILSADADTPFARHRGSWVSRRQLWAQAAALAETLPDRPQVVNLCQDRYLFALTLVAAGLRGQVCLLPPSAQTGVLDELLSDYPEAYPVSDADDSLSHPRFAVAVPVIETPAALPEFDLGKTAVIAFTSGSTGYPKACPHTWGTFQTSARMALNSLRLPRGPLMVVSTTPPQHMYGLETSVFWPLFSQLVLCPARPFFPEDMRRLIQTAPLPCLLASTPTHLRSLAASGGDWRNLAGIVSSTDRLDEDLARQIEQVTGVPVQEIYGSSETLSFASRETTREVLWRPYVGARLLPREGGEIALVSPHLPEGLILQDSLQVDPDGRFMVLGRHSDLIKIGGKRISLAELNRRLLAIEGVEDGLFQVLQGPSTARLRAVVVSRLSKPALLQSLRPFMDEVFLPRRIYFLERIPRNEVGKVIRSELESLLDGMDRSNETGF